MLSDTKVRALKPRDKPYKVCDSQGLHLLVSTSGARLWRFDYRFLGRRKTLALGQYPEVSLSEAREKLEQARKLLASGIDPSVSRKAAKQAVADTFGIVYAEWREKRESVCAPVTLAKYDSRANNYILPHLRDIPVSKVNKDHLKDILARVDKVGMGSQDTGHAILNIVRHVMRYAILHDRAIADPTVPLREGRVLKPLRYKHYPALLDRKALGNYMKAANAYTFSPIVRAALLLQALLFVRPGELRKLEWANVDFEAGLLRVMPENLKLSSKEKKNPLNRHLVPLSRQAAQILMELKELTGSSRYAFVGPRLLCRPAEHHKPMSNRTVNVALRFLGYDSDTLTGHGFRATARTLIAEELTDRIKFHNVNEVIELQLAHAVKDMNGRAYNRVQFMPERHELMQVWADWLWEISEIA